MTFDRSIKIAPSILSAGSALFSGGSVQHPEIYGRNISAIRKAAEAALQHEL